MGNCSPEKESKLVFSIDTFENFLAGEVESLSKKILEDFRRNLNEDSLTLFELGYLLVSGGLIDALGEDHVVYLREKGASEEFIQRAKGFCDEIDNKHPDFFHHSDDTREAKRETMVRLGVSFLPPTNDALADIDRHFYLVEIAGGRMKPPDSWIKKYSQ